MKSNTRFALVALVAAMIVVGGSPPAVRADTAEQTFYRAEVEYKKFKTDEKRTRFRDGWLRCIRKFEKAFQKDPDGRLAPASLYMAGELYRELFARSALDADRDEAVDAFRRVVRRFPRSDYRPKAESGLKELSASVPRPGGRDAAVPRLTAKISKERTAAAPERSERPDTPGVLSPKVEKPADVPGAAGRKICDPECRASKAAYRARDREPEPTPRRAEKPRPEPREDRVSHLIRRASVGPAGGGGFVAIEGLRFWSNPNYTRIVVDADRETGYSHELLEPDVAAHKPQRLYIDFRNSRLGRNLPDVLPIDDDLLRAARAGQRSPDTVRVVIDIKSFKTYKIFSLNNPFRTIIDVWGSDAGERLPSRAAAAAPRPMTPVPPISVGKVALAPESSPRVTPNDLARQLALGVRRIVVDPGHGGHDPGAPGALKGVWEKDVVLQLGLRLEKMIRRTLGAEVIMTRRTDRFLSLEERTAIANTNNADLFVSIHCNASKNRSAYGIETYYLNLATDDDAILVAARENATSRKNISDLQTILNDLMQNAKINESSRLAGHVQTSMFRTLKNRYGHIRSKGVKQAPFYVLLGAQMPSILVETSFISNRRECERLLTEAYQDHVCDAILAGIEDYIRETTPTAFRRSPADAGTAMASIR